MALTEKKIEIVEAYLANKCSDKGAAVKAVDPTIKNPNAYAWKIFNDIEVKEYLLKRRNELLLESGLDMKVITKALTKNLYGSLGLVNRTILAHGKNGFDTITGLYEDSGDVKNYWGVLKDILGSEISGAIANKELQEDKKIILQEKESKLKIMIDKENLEVKKIETKFKRIESEAYGDGDNE